MLAPEPLKNNATIIKAKPASTTIAPTFEEKLLFQDTSEPQLVMGIQPHRCV